ncbi:MAG: topoisomerase subunit [Verrucomicrobiales bacterium]|nr:topoisomerase subunit [Verrucomicrobiales bacterium]
MSDPANKSPGEDGKEKQKELFPPPSQEPAKGNSKPEGANEPITQVHSAPFVVDGPLHKRMDTSFMEYASYVIRDRAIPNLADGLKPVQRRILWSLHEKDDGKFIKVATISGHCAQYHPHGDAAINDAMVVLTNKRYLIEGQGNFGNVHTGDPAAAARYIECRLTELARNELFNDDLTEFVASYDGRNKEPVHLPSRLPTLLMLGTEGIAVGMSCKILPHNFIELLEAQICILKKQPFKCLPDFRTGGLMDARDYADGKGSIKVRAKIKVKDSSTLSIKEIPPMTTTDSLIGSIEDAVRKGKLKVKSINDFTAEDVEIEIKVSNGLDAEQLVDGLYAFTDCEVSITSRIIVIKNNRPVELTVSEVLRENTAQLLDLNKRELELKESKLQQDLHYKTLVRLFIENRIYKKIEQSKSNEAVYAAIYEGFKPLRAEMFKDLSDEDVAMLLEVRIRRISLFDINKHKEEIEKVKAELEETRKHLKNITKYTIGRLDAMIAKYRDQYPRLTKSSRYDEVDAKDVAFKGFKVSYDRESGYVGYKVAGDEFRIDCTKFDKLLFVFKDGHYKVVELQEKMFVGPDLLYCAIPERDRVFTLCYTNREATYIKRFAFGGIIMNKEYFCIPEKSRIMFFEADTPEQLFIKYKPAPHQKISQQTCKPSEIEVKTPKTLGRQISIKDVGSINGKPPRNWDPGETTTKVLFT